MLEIGAKISIKFLRMGCDQSPVAYSLNLMNGNFSEIPRYMTTPTRGKKRDYQ